MDNPCAVRRMVLINEKTIAMTGQRQGHQFSGNVAEHALLDFFHFLVSGGKCLTWRTKPNSRQAAAIETSCPSEKQMIPSAATSMMPILQRNTAGGEAGRGSENKVPFVAALC